MRAIVGALFLLLSLNGVGAGQVSGPQPATQLPAEADPGVRPFRLIDRDEIRVARVELQPGAARRVHVHDDVEYHVWTPVVGTLEITIGNDGPKSRGSGPSILHEAGDAARLPQHRYNAGGGVRDLREEIDNDRRGRG